MKIIKGNIFNTKCQTIVNTVNTVGIMGAGIALEFKFRYPEMFKKYKVLCDNGSFEMGKLWLYKHSNNKYVFNFPTKVDWKYPTKEEYLFRGLEKFAFSYERIGIKSIAFPLLGASNGGIGNERSLEIMEHYLTDCQIPIEIYQYDPKAYDDLYISFRNKLDEFSIEELILITKIKRHLLLKIIGAVKDTNIHSISQLATVNGIGLVTLEKVFMLCIKPAGITRQKQLDLGIL